MEVHRQVPTMCTPSLDMALAEARKLVSNRLAETKKYAPEAKKVAQQEFQARREDWWFAGNLASSFKLLYSSHGCLAFFFWEPKLEHTNISDTCSKWAVQGLFYIYTDTLPSRTLIYECCLRDFLNPSPSPSDHRRQHGAQRQAMEKRLSEASKRLQPLRKFRQAFRGLLVCGALRISIINLACALPTDMMCSENQCQPAPSDAFWMRLCRCEWWRN